MTNATREGLHFTVAGAAPTSNLDVRNDVRMLKAALLYADRVTVYSLKSFFILGATSMPNTTVKERLEWMEAALPLMEVDEEGKSAVRRGIEDYRSLLRKRFLNSKEVQRKVAFDSMMNTWDVQSVISDLIKRAGAEDLIELLNNDKVEIHRFNAKMTGRMIYSADARSNAVDRIVDEYYKGVSLAVLDASTYPLFDDQTGNLIHHAVSEGKLVVSDGSVTRSKRGGLAGDILQRLPLFDLANVNEILDIRRELEPHLVRFRAAIIGFSDAIKNAQWDRDFDTEADTVFYQRIEPAIKEIEEAVSESSFRRQLIRSVIGSPPKLLSAGALTAAIAAPAALPSMLSHLVTTGAATSVALSSLWSALSAYQTASDAKQGVEHRDLFFYYRARANLEQRLQ